jgi:Peptidase family M23
MIPHDGTREDRMIRMTSMRMALAAAALAATAAAAAGPAAGASTGIRPDTAFAAFEAQVLTRPQPVLGTDGARHIAYELVLTGTTPASLKVTRVQVRDAGTKRVLLSLSGRRLTTHLTKLGDTETPLAGGVIGGSETAIVWLDVRLPPRGRVPERLDHVVTGVVQAKGGGPTVTGVLTPVRTLRRAPVVLGPPIGGGGTWFASDGCCTNYTHHRWGTISVNGALAVPQRFAIDWYVLDDLNRTWIGDPSRLTSYLSYGRPVIASADGVVVSARDGVPETTSAPEPPPVPPIGDTVGNQVTIRVSPGVFLLHGHMQPGSIRVRVGERVRRGDVLGLIGSSGNSTTPHLHFQVLTTPTFFPTDSTPWVFDRFELVGQVTRRIWDDDLGLQPTGTMPVAPARNPGLRRNQMPLDRNVIVLPEA